MTVTGQIHCACFGRDVTPPPPLLVSFDWRTRVTDSMIRTNQRKIGSGAFGVRFRADRRAPSNPLAQVRINVCVAFVGSLSSATAWLQLALVLVHVLDELEVAALDSERLIDAGQTDRTAALRLVEALAHTDQPVELGPRLQTNEPHLAADEALERRRLLQRRGAALVTGGRRRRLQVALELCAKRVGSELVELFEEVQELLLRGGAVDRRLGVGVAERPAPQPDLGDGETEERDCSYRGSNSRRLEHV